MRLGEIIQALESVDPDMVVPVGFHDPHSYRGYYEQLEFEPLANCPVSTMLASARSALGATFTGYKGGDYEMDEHTDCCIGHYGEADGQQIGRILLHYMIGIPWEGPNAN